ncbi:MAG: adenylate/guanylate cyclase domain-containing protein [bacterium]
MANDRERGPSTKEKPESLNLPPGERPIKSEVSILSVGFAGFAKFTEEKRPEETERFLNAYFNAINMTIGRYKGWIDRLLEGTIQVAFPVPDAAVAAGEEILKGAKKISPPDIENPPQIRISVHTGIASIVRVGPPGNRRPIVTGLPVRLAQHLDMATKPGQLFITEATFHQLREKERFRKIGLLKLKGKERGLLVYALIPEAPPKKEVTKEEVKAPPEREVSAEEEEVRKRDALIRTLFTKYLRAMLEKNVSTARSIVESAIKAGFDSKTVSEKIFRRTLNGLSLMVENGSLSDEVRAQAVHITESLREEFGIEPEEDWL